jgi:hypothetical protein
MRRAILEVPRCEADQEAEVAVSKQELARDGAMRLPDQLAAV